MNRSTALKYSYLLLPGICYLLEYLIWKWSAQSSALNGILGGLWTIGQFGILLLLVALHNAKISANVRWSLIGIFVTSIGSVCYICNYLFGYWLAFDTKLFLPMGALFTGIGMIIVGYQVFKGRVWTGTFAYAPLLVGIYPFAIMFPLVLVTGHPDINAILGWGVPWLMFGIAMMIHKQQMATSAR